jgi:hypothetical protein
LPNLQTKFSIKTESEMALQDLSIAPLIGIFMRPLIGDNLLRHISEPSSTIDKQLTFNQLILATFVFRYVRCQKTTKTHSV